MGVWHQGVGSVVLVALAAGSHASSPIPNGVNITVYHVNPVQYGVAPINMNTADILGDMYFDLRSKALPIECASNDPNKGRDCDNAEVANNSALVITKLVLEVNPDFGQYGLCNICVNGSDHHGNNSCVDGAYNCNCGSFTGPSKPCGSPVGFMNISAMMARHRCDAGDPNFECWHDSTARKTGGKWFSTVDVGYCGDGTTPAPPGCTWRVAEFVKRVNKTCSDNVIYGEVEAFDPTTCFGQCTDSGVGKLRNTTSPCWIGCFYDTVLGPDAGTPGGAVAGMPLQDLVTAWGLPFASEDPAKKGCPALDE